MPTHLRETTSRTATHAVSAAVKCVVSYADLGTMQARAALAEAQVLGDLVVGAALAGPSRAAGKPTWTR